jgi:sulfoxide reductase catalytic subunit YedY
MDEAMNDLALVTVGMYGDVLQTPNGPPIRIIVPWKYGFKSIKSINKIEFVEEQPLNTWNVAQPWEYGFFSNVNPERDHPRWSQRTERRFGQRGRTETTKFNGYGEWVAGMYAGMDLINTYY